uniref:Uncharacterized protein n=1 Tax=Acanthochromis polyacanthus TaxID=80966 RepID=A0A3Q1FY35_9TELE
QLDQTLGKRRFGSWPTQKDCAVLGFSVCVCVCAGICTCASLDYTPTPTCCLPVN